MAAAFAASAGERGDLGALHREICHVAAEGLNADFAQLLVHDRDTQTLHPAAGLDWQPEDFSRARSATDTATAAGFVVQSGQCVVLNDHRVDSRFRPSGSARERGLTRSIIVPVAEAGATTAVLEVGSSETGLFLETDTHFLQLLARSMAGAQNRLARRPSPDRGGEQDVDQPPIAVQELQHRIRNDLQVICSSIEREMRRLGDLPQRTGYGRLSRQVMAIADLYQHLRISQSEDVIDMGAYLQALGHRIAVASDLGARGIEFVAEIEPISTAPQKAKSIGIVVNELVANAAEHAFPDGQAGTISLRLSVSADAGDNRMELTVSDDGCGFQQRRPGRAGLTLVECMVKAAGGVLKRLDGAGTRWQITL